MIDLVIFMLVVFLAHVVDRWQRRGEVWFSDVAKRGKPVVRQIEERKTSLGSVWCG